MNSENNIGKSIPRNPNTKMSDDEINSLLELATNQVNGNMGRENIELKKKEEKKQAQETKRRIEEIKKKTDEDAKKEERKKKEAAKKEAAKKEETKRLEEARRKEAAKKEETKRLEEARKKEAAKKEAAKKEEVRRKEEAGKNQKKREVTVSEDIDFSEDVYVTESVGNPYKEKWTFGRVVGTFLETVWVIFKLAVIVAVVTVISGFFLSRDMMIRGRNGARQCLEGMTVASNVARNKSLEFTKVDSWLNTVDIQKHTLEADDGKMLIARSFAKSKNGNKWVVVLHGYGETMEDVYDIAMHYSNDGYNILIPDLRAHGESEGAFYGMGWLDRLDVINWIDLILENNPSSQIAIHGVDMGADTALMLAGEPLKSNIKVIVAEGAYTSAWDVVKKEYKVRNPKLPVFPFLYMINPVMKVWAGYSLSDADAVSQVKNARIPILLVNGNNDTYADGDMTEKLNLSIASEHEVFTIANGSHGDCRYADGDTYYGRVLEFVNSNMK